MEVCPVNGGSLILEAALKAYRVQTEVSWLSALCGSAAHLPPSEV